MNWVFSSFIANLSHFYLSDLSFLSPNLQLAHLPSLQSAWSEAHRPTDWQTDSVCDHEWRTYLRDSESSQTHYHPSPIHRRALYISQPACLHVSPHCWLCHPRSVSVSLSMSAWQCCYSCLSAHRMVCAEKRSFLAVISVHWSHFTYHCL